MIDLTPPTDVQGKCRLIVSTPCRIVENKNGDLMLETISMHWHRHRMALGLPFAFAAGEVNCDGYEIGVARNLVVKMAREHRADWVFFIDNDVLVPAHAFRQLMYRATATHTEYDIFSGVYCVKENPPSPIIFKGWGEGTFWDWTVGDVLDQDIRAVPMGCTLLRLSLFDRLPYSEENPWFKTVELLNGNMRGMKTEDVYFCKRAVEEAGCKILVDTSIQCGHINNDTGEIFTLPQDCPPVVRAGIKMEAKAC